LTAQQQSQQQQHRFQLSLLRLLSSELHQIPFQSLIKINKTQ
jgi:hypothetical protein